MDFNASFKMGDIRGQLPSNTVTMLLCTVRLLPLQPIEGALICITVTVDGATVADRTEQDQLPFVFFVLMSCVVSMIPTASQRYKKVFFDEIAPTPMSSKVSDYIVDKILTQKVGRQQEILLCIGQ